MKKQPFLHSFLYAVQGVRTALREERNLRFHVCTAFYVYVFSLFYEFTRTEYCLITMMVGGVMALELVNSSLERAVERPVPERYMTAGAVKDMAAGGVLICAGFAVGVGVCLFWQPAAFLRIWRYFLDNPAMIAVLLASIALALVYILAGPLGIRDFFRKKKLPRTP